MIHNQNCDWAGARNAYPLEPIDLGDGLWLRPLIAADLRALSDIMTNDAEMTWTRTVWSIENVAFLLNLRLRHYEQYGFGVYGLERGQELIGMAGAQVWEYAPCAIEILAYVAKQHWSKGVASTALQWTIGRAKQVGGFPEIYAATRPENLRAVSLAERSGFERVGEGEHYGHNSMHWRLRL